MMTRQDAQTLYDNSGIGNFDHGFRKFNEEEMVDYFYKNGESVEDLENCFIEYMALKNDVETNQIKKEYGIE